MALSPINHSIETALSRSMVTYRSFNPSSTYILSRDNIVPKGTKINSRKQKILDIKIVCDPSKSQYMNRNTIYLGILHFLLYTFFPGDFTYVLCFSDHPLPLVTHKATVPSQTIHLRFKPPTNLTSPLACLKGIFLGKKIHGFGPNLKLRAPAIQ